MSDGAVAVAVTVAVAANEDDYGSKEYMYQMRKERVKKHVLKIEDAIGELLNTSDDSPIEIKRSIIMKCIKINKYVNDPWYHVYRSLVSLHLSRSSPNDDIMLINEAWYIDGFVMAVWNDMKLLHENGNSVNSKELIIPWYSLKEQIDYLIIHHHKDKPHIINLITKEIKDEALKDIDIVQSNPNFKLEDIYSGKDLLWEQLHVQHLVQIVNIIRPYLPHQAEVINVLKSTSVDQVELIVHSNSNMIRLHNNLYSLTSKILMVFIGLYIKDSSSINGLISGILLFIILILIISAYRKGFFSQLQW